MTGEPLITKDGSKQKKKLKRGECECGCVR
jgi:hypothetical protein